MAKNSQVGLGPFKPLKQLLNSKVPSWLVGAALAVVEA